LNAPIYLDYAATTPVAPEVAECMMHYLTIDGVFANPSSIQHCFGEEAETAVENARATMANGKIPALQSKRTGVYLWRNGVQ